MYSEKGHDEDIQGDEAGDAREQGEAWYLGGDIHQMRTERLSFESMTYSKESPEHMGEMFKRIRLAIRALSGERLVRNWWDIPTFQITDRLVNPYGDYYIVSWHIGEGEVINEMLSELPEPYAQALRYATELLGITELESVHAMTLQLSKATKAVGDKLWENLTADDEGSAYAECYAAAIRGDADAEIGALQKEIVELRTRLAAHPTEPEYDADVERKAWQAANPAAAEAEGAPGDNWESDRYRDTYLKLVEIIFGEDTSDFAKVTMAKREIVKSNPNVIGDEGKTNASQLQECKETVETLRTAIAQQEHVADERNAYQEGYDELVAIVSTTGYSTKAKELLVEEAIKRNHANGIASGFPVF